MNYVFFVYPEDTSLAKLLESHGHITVGEINFRNFPDTESYVRIKTDVRDKRVMLLCSLNKPNEKIIPLLFLAKTARELGAKEVGLIAPYLAYMRQDKRFQSGEAVNSRCFAELLSQYFDWLITIDPHLHRHHSLDEIYRIPTTVLHAAEFIADWIRAQIKQPIIIGPDSESEQWVSHVAKLAQAPYAVLQKVRTGDKEVKVSLPEIDEYRDFTPILVDDIISTARTMIETVQHIETLQMKPPICIGIHAIFAGDAYEALRNSRINQVVTCNTISHLTNRIDISPLIVNILQQQMEKL